MTAFTEEQRRDQTRFFSAFPADRLMPKETYRLADAHKGENLNPSCQQAILDHFGEGAGSIQWHQHANHALSSQICCVNFLAPLMRRPDALSQVIGAALGIPAPKMEPVSTDSQGAPIYVDFEWIGAANHLDEWPATGSASRGANATSADAAVNMAGPDGQITTILIEWKYTESYGAPIPPKGNDKRLSRYSVKAFHPNGPIRADLGLTVADFFWEPFYQLMRQQMLALAMERAGEGGASKVMVLHISAAGNLALHNVTAPALRKFGTDAFDLWPSLLQDPSRFRATSIELAFLPALTQAAAIDPNDPWASYLLSRYGFLTAPIR